MPSATSCIPNAYWRKLATNRLVGSPRRGGYPTDLGSLTRMERTCLLPAKERGPSSTRAPALLFSSFSDSPRIQAVIVALYHLTGQLGQTVLSGRFSPVLDVEIQRSPLDLRRKIRELMARASVFLQQWEKSPTHLARHGQNLTRSEQHGHHRADRPQPATGPEPLSNLRKGRLFARRNSSAMCHAASR